MVLKIFFKENEKILDKHADVKKHRRIVERYLTTGLNYIYTDMQSISLNKYSRTRVRLA